MATHLLPPDQGKDGRMRKLVPLAAIMGALLLLYASGVLAQPQIPTQNIPDSYIVVFKDGVQRPAAAANEHARANGLQLRFVYTSAIKGYAAVIPNDRALQRVENDPRVDYVEHDQVVRAEEQVLPWGMNRIDADISSTLAGNGTADVGTNPDNTPQDVRNVHAYIIDTGIDTDHTDLNVGIHVNPSGAGGGNEDCNGHGTHVAGTVAAIDNTQDVVGVAPDAPLTAVKVLGCSGSGSTSGVIEGVDWVTQNAQKPAVANMSLGGGVSQAEDDAVRKSADSGIFYSIAAMNNGANACNYSPARAGRTKNADGTWNKDNGIMTVAATNSSNEEASWSNYGPCVDIWAPGVNVKSTKLGGGTTLMSGTSMAAPHVGGGGALYLSGNKSASSSETEIALKEAANPLATKSKNGDSIVLENVGGF
jgi:subtilisin family serine protease